MGNTFNWLMLASLFEKKKLGEAIGAEEKWFIRSVRRARMLSMLIDPEVTDLDIGTYVPPLLELELCYAAVSGRQAPKDLSMEEVTKQAFYGLSVMHDILNYFNSNAQEV